MKIQLFLVQMLFIIPVASEAQSLEWAKQLGGSGHDEGRSVTIDDLGNVYVTGIFADTGDFDPGPGVFNLFPTGDWDVYITKLDPMGNFIWAKQIGGNDMTHVYSIFVDSNKNIYLTGGFTGICDFDPGPGSFALNASSTSMGDIYVLKLDPAGNLVWAKQFADPMNTDRGVAVGVDDSGNVITVGNFVGTCDFDPGPGTYDLTSMGGDDIFVSKLDSLGNFVWAKSMGGSVHDYVQNMSMDEAGNIYVTGQFGNTVDFDPGPGAAVYTASGIADVFIFKMDGSGNLVWAKAIGGIDLEGSRGLTLDKDGNVLLAGEFAGTVDFNPGLGIFNMTATGLSDAFVLKLDNTGNIVWARQIKGSDYTAGYSVATDTAGNIYTGGRFESTVTINSGAGTISYSSAGNYDIYMLSLDAAGQYRWSAHTGGPGYQDVIDIEITREGEILSTGIFFDTCDFNAGPGVYELISFGARDAYIYKMSQCFGPDVNITASGATLTVAETGSTYQWLDCDNGYAGITGETAQSYTATVNGNYAVMVTTGDCTDTSACVSVTNANIMEIHSEAAASLYPTITNGTILLRMPSLTENTHFCVMNIAGEMVMKRDITQQMTEIDLQQLPGGIYLLKTNRHAFKFIKQ